MKNQGNNGRGQDRDESFVDAVRGQGRPDNPGGGKGQGGNNGQGGNKGQGSGPPDNPGQGKGDLYGDQYVLLRDLNPADGGGNGEPMLDDNGQNILVGSDGSLIYYELDPATGDYEIPADQAGLVQEVELGRANVARAPDSVMERSLNEALTKIMSASVVSTDAAGRITTDGVAIDSPLENLALYQYLMTAGGQQSWTAVQDYWPDAIVALENWDPSSLLGAAFDKFTPVSMDAVLYQNTTLGVNQVTGNSVEYFDFTLNGAEAYDYSREARWSDTYIQWYENLDDDPELELVEPTSVYDAVFGGQPWTDAYLQNDGTIKPVTSAGVNDFAQAVEDARAVIYFMHENLGAIEVPAPVELEAASLSATNVAVPRALQVAAAEDAHDHDEGHDHEEHETTVIMGTQFDDWLFGAGGAQYIEGGNGDDHLYGRGGPDTLIGGNGSDTLMGGGGPDILNGGNGSDVLDGGPGPDILNGGRGPDTFVFGTMHGGHGSGRGGGHESGHGSDHSHDAMIVSADVLWAGRHGMDVITDFKPGVDVMDFSAIEGELHFAQGPEAFGIWVEASGHNTMVYVDTNGQSQGTDMAEMAVQLVGVHADQLGAESFVV